MAHLLIFGLGYTARRIAEPLRARGWRVDGTSRDGRAGTIAFADRPAIAAALASASHILISTPPDDRGLDPVIDGYGDAVAASGAWTGYLSSTGVYGDTGGAWVDEGAPTGLGRRSARAQADADWLRRGARVFRLPGIYGPGRSALDRVREGKAHLIDMPDQVFSRIHIDDIVSGVLAGMNAPPGAYNLADDLPCSQNAVIELACALLRVAPPPLIAIDDARLSPMARAFYAENRRIANGRAKRALGWAPRYPDYRVGLRALNAMISPAMTSAAPITANTDQR